MTEAIRIYLSKRIDLLLIDIANAHKEIQLINSIMLEQHETERDRHRVSKTCIPQPVVRPPLAPARSESDLRHRAPRVETPTPPVPMPLHPAHRAAVDSQSKTLN